MVNTRNFCIISHVDHGKSTLADRLIEITGTVSKDKLKPQLLDSLALERERGITIKLAPIRMSYVLNSKFYILNLIDTPGHVDFSYEVSRSLAAVEGAILLVDATQGIQAQTLAHGLAAKKQNLRLIPVINKVDLDNADIARCKKELVETFGFLESEILLASGKTGQGVSGILEAIVDRVPSPHSSNSSVLKALIFGSFFDPYKGVVSQVRVVEGESPKIGEKLAFIGTKASGTLLEAGYFSPQLSPCEKLTAGEIGYLASGIKQADQVRVGDTISTGFETSPLPGYREVKSMVYIGLYPTQETPYQELKEALAKFKLNDPAFLFEPESSIALGPGFRCGFLGLLHAEVVQERLKREFGINLMATSPSVAYLTDGKLITNPADLELDKMRSLKEPWISLRIFTPSVFLGYLLELIWERRGKVTNQRYFADQVELSCEMPLSEMVTNFYDWLKSVSSGYASLDYEFLEYRDVEAVKIDLLVAGQKVDALSTIVYRPKAEEVGRSLVERLKEVLPRQNFEVAIQAAIGGKVIARQTLSAYRKDVTSPLYGGDRTRKDKLLEKQRKGKQRMKTVGRVQIPQEAFLAILKVS